MQGQRGLPYSLVIHAYSNLSFRAKAIQSGYAPGATVQLVATLAESGVPIDGDAAVWAEVTTPANQIIQVALTRADLGLYQGSFAAADSGVYRARVRASGKTLRGFPFLREQTVTAGVWIGGNGQGGSGVGGSGECMCKLLNCLFGPKGVITAEGEQLLKRLGFDVAALRRCLTKCAQKGLPASERTTAATSQTASGALNPAAQLLLEQLVSKLGQTGTP
jgi:hypothetical protein